MSTSIHPSPSCRAFYPPPHNHAFVSNCRRSSHTLQKLVPFPRLGQRRRGGTYRYGVGVPLVGWLLDNDRQHMNLVIMLHHPRPQPYSTDLFTKMCHCDEVWSKAYPLSLAKPLSSFASFPSGCPVLRWLSQGRPSTDTSVQVGLP